MSIFDQRGQQVTYQYNAAGSINFGAVQNQLDFVDQLVKLKDEVTKARDAGVISKKDATTIESHINQAINEVEGTSPNKQTLLDHINSAKKLIETIASATGLVTAFTSAIDAIQKLFG